LFFETGSHCVVQADPEFTILLPQPPESDIKNMHPANGWLFLSKYFQHFSVLISNILNTDIVSIKI
jgi:hypothetical protein